MTPSKATRLSSLSLEEQKAQQPAAPATVKQERTRKGKAARGGAAAAAEAATESATSAAAVVSTVVGEAEYEAVKAHVLRCFRAGASVPVAATAKALQLPKDKAEAALKR